MKEYRHMKGTTRADTIAAEFAAVLQMAAQDAHFDFEARIKVAPAEKPILNHLGSNVSWVDYEILLDEVGNRHEEAGVIPSRKDQRNGGR